MNFAKLSMGVLVAALTYSQTLLAADSQMVSNDGVLPIPLPTPTRFLEPGNVGRGIGAYQDDHPATEATLAPPTLSRLSKIPTAVGSPEPEAILGIDTRVEVVPIKYPYTAVALIDIGTMRCSGWMIGEDTVVTAGHCVHGGEDSEWYPIEQFTVYPSYTGTEAPFGSCKAVRTYSTKGWALAGNPDFDYGAIKLDCDIGKYTGYFGYAAFSTLGHLNTIVNGYPGDKPLSQWMAVDRVRAEDENWLYYRNDTLGGVSGSPVWYDAGRLALTIAIHTYRTTNHNRGARINKRVFENLKAWKYAHK